MAPIDLGPEARTEAALGLQLDAVPLGEGDRQVGTRDVAALDEDRAQQPVGLSLLRERKLELAGRDEAFLNSSSPSGRQMFSAASTSGVSAESPAILNENMGGDRIELPTSWV